ncbi:hypothetical protein EDB19DRAFT_1706526 [Suillus lakei]|nr:hypothetical protein EDB19DRAFT_1706526 [Suillus lakei]
MLSRLYPSMVRLWTSAQVYSLPNAVQAQLHTPKPQRRFQTPPPRQMCICGIDAYTWIYEFGPPNSDVCLGVETTRRSVRSGLDPEPLPIFILAFNIPVPFFEWLEDGDWKVYCSHVSYSVTTITNEAAIVSSAS